MATRCHIAFYEDATQPLDQPGALLYRHSHGYPDTKHGVLTQLLPFLRTLAGWNALHDPESVAARTLQHLANLYDQHPEARCIEYGICRNFHRDIAYLYAVYPKEHFIEVYETDWNAGLEAATLTRTIRIA